MRPLIHIVADIFVTPVEYVAFSLALILVSCMPAFVIAYRTHKSFKRTEAAIRAEDTEEYKRAMARHGNTTY